MGLEKQEQQKSDKQKSTMDGGDARLRQVPVALAVALADEAAADDAADGGGDGHAGEVEAKRELKRARHQRVVQRVCLEAHPRTHRTRAADDCNRNKST